MKRFVLGGGVSALVFAYYNHDVKVVDSGRTMADSPFVFIHQSEYTDKLLQDLGIRREIKNVVIRPKIASDVLKGKIGKTEREYIGTDRIGGIGTGNLLKVYDLKETDLCALLRAKVKGRIIKAKCTKITDSHITMQTENGTITEPYSEIISNLHFRAFQDICPSWSPGKNIRTFDMSAVEEDYSGDLDYIEYHNEDCDCSKVVCNSIVGKIGIEYSDPKKAPQGARLYKGLRLDGTINPPPDKILFVGRFSSGNSHWRIEDSIFIAQQGYLLLKILTEQRRFDAAVISANPNITFENRIHNLLLHLHSEISELLRETNYKMHMLKSRDIKSSSVLEEGIDIIKLTMSILNMFNYTEREIYEMFYSKTNFTWKKFLDSFYGGV